MNIDEQDKAMARGFGEALALTEAAVSETTVSRCSQCGQQMRPTDREERIAEQQKQEPFAWVEHHKGGDNLVWERSTLPCDPLFSAPPQDALDAKRYRYMRSNAMFQDRNGPGAYWYLPRWDRSAPVGVRLDAAIDAAMNKEPKCDF